MPFETYLEELLGLAISGSKSEHVQSCRPSMLPGRDKKNRWLAVSSVVADGSVTWPGHGLHSGLHICQVYALDVDL